MPRDDWAKARTTDLVRRSRRKNEFRGSRRKARNTARHVNQLEKSRLSSLDTVLWFGRYKGRTVRDLQQVDPDYLLWLAGSECNPAAWRMNVLCEFLRSIQGQEQAQRIPQPWLTTPVRTGVHDYDPTFYGRPAGTTCELAIPT